jgi:ATP-dependent RNA helicase RhlE
MTFKDLGLSELYIERLKDKGIHTPTEIQVELFQPIISGESVLGLAKTGTGKTLSYLGPLVERYSARGTDQEKNVYNAAMNGALVWVLVPTRELATQVKDTHEILTHAQSQVAVVVGGESEDRQIDALNQARFVVATPGRLLDLLQRKRLSTRNVEVVVMDEADRLLDMGFIDDIRAILRFLEKKPQLVFVSATLHLGVEEVAFEMGIEAKRFGNAEEMPTVEGLDHGVAFVGDSEKFHALAHFIFDRKDQRGIVFSNYREKAHELASRLRGLGCKSDALSAQLSQAQRSRIVEDYRAERLKVLVASDLAARGLDFFDIEYVVNFDLPEDPATYVHRVGRTARAGRKGKALSFIGFEDSFRLEKLERFLGKKLKVEELDVTKLSGPLPRFAPRSEASTGEEVGRTPSQERRQDRAPLDGKKIHRQNIHRKDAGSRPLSESPPISESPPKREAYPDSYPESRVADKEVIQHKSPARVSKTHMRHSREPQGLWDRMKKVLLRLLGLGQSVGASQSVASRESAASRDTSEAKNSESSGKRRSSLNRGHSRLRHPRSEARNSSSRVGGHHSRGHHPRGPHSNRKKRGPRSQGATDTSALEKKKS